MVLNHVHLNGYCALWNVCLKDYVRDALLELCRHSLQIAPGGRESSRVDYLFFCTLLPVFVEIRIRDTRLHHLRHAGYPECLLSIIVEGNNIPFRWLGTRHRSSSALSLSLVRRRKFTLSGEVEWVNVILGLKVS